MGQIDEASRTVSEKLLCGVRVAVVMGACLGSGSDLGAWMGVRVRVASGWSRLESAPF